MSRSVINFSKEKSHIDSPMFLDPNGSMGTQRYETLKYEKIDKLTDKQMGFFWRPEEVELNKDIKDFKGLDEHEKHIFTSNLKRQILLDSVQGRSPSLGFLPLISIPELEAWTTLWSFNETVHSRSYTHIIRNIYANPSIVFDEMMDIQEIIDCGADVSKYYDNLIEYSNYYQLLGYGTHTVNGKKVEITEYELKKRIYLAMLSVNVLEGIRFYVSFACSWAFAELKSMEGNAKIIKLICRDENLHLGFTQTVLKMMPKDDPIFAKIAEDTKEEATAMYLDAVQQEKEWAKYLFKDGSIIGLNEELLCQYVEFIANKRMKAVGLVSPFKGGSDPLPWTGKWISGSEVQVAPQETQITSYTIGAVKQDITEDTLKGFSL
jgi:ribonucleoside-diphosphate reductase beta chain